jgi:ATP-dependent RNA helicase DeaD
MIDRLLDQGYASTDICSALIHLLQGGGGPAAAPAPKEERTSRPEPERAPVAAPPAAVPTPEAPAVVPERPAAKAKYERPPRTGREEGMTTLFLNVGRKQLVTPADVVGKIAGVTRLPAAVVGAIDIHQRHCLVDVAGEQAGLILAKLAGVRLKGVVLAPALAGQETG